MASLNLRNTLLRPLTNSEIDANFTNINDEVATKLNSSSYTASDVLSKLLTVDVNDSGINATTLNGVTFASTNTVSTLVQRDASGNFAAGAITGTSFTSTGTISASGQTLTIGTVDATTVNATTFNGNLYLGTTNSITFEGSADDTYETTLTVTNPTVDRTITFPDTTGTVITTGDSATVTNTMLAGSIANSKLANSSITIDGNSVSLGGSVTIAGSDITWTGAQTFRDNRFTITDNTTTSKALVFELSGITTSTTRTLTIPDESGTIATQTYVSNSLTTLVAPGVIVYFATSAAPTGWLKCNGAAISRSTYSNLFAAIAEIWGAGDGLSTFNIPDLRGEFVRVWDDSKGTDAGRIFGSSQSQATDAVYNVESLTTTASSTITIPTDGTFSSYVSTGSGTGRGIRFKRGGQETRPRNVALLACIKI